MTEITANYDETWKEVIGDYFESFLTFFIPKFINILIGINLQFLWIKN